MRKIPAFAAIAAAIALSGCANVIDAATDDIAKITATLSSPAATQAAANLKAGSQAIACDFTAVANAADQIALAVAAGKAVQKDAQTALVVSNIVCTALGGAPMGTVTIPAS
ncbi:MAG: hypothetical protein ABR863_10020 [Roseiarcus sp.]|jgi:hypothetical protein